MWGVKKNQGFFNPKIKIMGKINIEIKSLDLQTEDPLQRRGSCRHRDWGGPELTGVWIHPGIPSRTCSSPTAEKAPEPTPVIPNH